MCKRRAGVINELFQLGSPRTLHKGLLRGLEDAAGCQEKEAGVRVRGREAADQRHPQEHHPPQRGPGTAQPPQRRPGRATSPPEPRTAVTCTLQGTGHECLSVPHSQVQNRVISHSERQLASAFQRVLSQVYSPD